MKHLSIKAKLTLYYGFIMTLLIVVLFSIYFIISTNQIVTAAQNALISHVHDSIDEISYKHGKIHYSSDLMKTDDGIFISVYDDKNEMVYGRIPYGFDYNLVFDESGIQTITYDSSDYSILDISYFPDGKTHLHIRGIVSLTEAKKQFQGTMNTMLILIPCILFACIFIGYRLARHAFLPVSTITKKVHNILISKDVSKRIALGKGNDEVYQMANTFDELLSEIEETMKREKRFTDDASHELRTPITVIIMKCEEILSNPQYENVHKEISIIKDKADSMHQMISQLLLFARIDANRIQVQKEPLDISELCSFTIEDLQYSANQKNITLHENIEEGLIIYGDQTLFIRFFMNLINNAIQYSNEHSDIYISLYKVNHMVKGLIKDEGIGIAPEHINKIWNRFYRVDTARNSTHSGLGLSMVKWIIETHNGKIYVNSTLNKGTTFSFEIPLYSQ